MSHLLQPRVRRAALLGIFLTCRLVVTAQGPSDDTDDQKLKRLSLEELSQIEVTTPSKEPVRAFQSPVAIYVITGEDIRRSGVTSIPEALRLAPGVEVARIDSNKWSIGIRGFGSRFSRGVLVLIDGRTVYTPLLAGTYWEVQDTMMEDIDRIEVIRGPGGTIWGPNAVNGVINVITKDSKDTHGILSSAGGGNETQGFASFRYGGGNQKLNYRIYGKGITRGPEDHPDHHNFDDWRSAQTGFRVDWNVDTLNSFTFQGDMYREEAGEAVQAVTYAPPYSRIVEANADLGGGNIMGKWKRILKNGSDIQIQAYFDRTTRFEPNFGDVRNTFDIDFLQHIRWARRQQVSWGLGTRMSFANNSEVVSGLTFRPNERTDQLYTAFLQDEIGLVEQRLSLIVGTKLLRTNFTGFKLEPSARLIWTPSSKQTFWTAYTHALRTPSDAEENFNLAGNIPSTGIPTFARFNANTNFASEQLNGYEAGYRRLFGGTFSIDIATFYNHYHDLFDEEITGPPFLEATPPPLHALLPAQFGNGLFGTTKGGEIAPEWRPASYWRLRGSYSYLQMDVRPTAHSLDVGTAPGIVGSSPRHEATIQSGWDLSKTLQLDVTYRYVSALPGQYVSIPALFVPAYSTGDAQFTWRVNRDFQVSAVGRNLFQPSHPEFAGDPDVLVGIKRSAYLKLTWTR